MEINVSKATYEKQWVEHDGCELLLEPYPTGQNDLVIRSDNDLVISGEQRRKMFMFSVKDWKGLVDSEKKPIPCNDEMKTLIFNHNLGQIPGFVYQWNSDFKKKLDEEFENLQSGQGGVLTQEASPAQTAKDK